MILGSSCSRTESFDVFSLSGGLVLDIQGRGIVHTVWDRTYRSGQVLRMLLWTVYSFMDMD